MAQEQVDREAREARELAQQPGGLVAVTFHEMYSPYNAGETAGVDRDLAARLVKAGKAHYFGETPQHEDGRPAFDGDQPVDLSGVVVEEKPAAHVERHHDTSGGGKNKR